MFSTSDYSTQHMRLITKPKQVPDNIATGFIANAERLALRKTLTATAAKMRVSKGHLCDLEHGRKNWTQATVDKFNKAVRSKR